MYISDNITRIFFYESYDNIAIVIMESQMKAIWLDVVLNEVVPQVSAKKIFFLLIKGSFTNYVGKILAYFDHLPPSIDIFYGMNVDKKWTFSDHLPTSSVL